ncbi:MAG: Xaa-Pro peptidase family protein [Thermofilaceae archaeon]|nr:Xaa-Pro peptidase family protein [Thermofilaceae archaeon]MDW8004505.1 Xaa-Pro peptidase family protein [Thermofilaceae archaeon]
MVDFTKHVKAVVQNILVKKELNALVVMGASNIHYLTGTDAPSAAIVYLDSNVKTLSSRLEYTRTLDESCLGEHYVYTKSEDTSDYENIIRGDFFNALKELVSNAPEGKLGIAGVSGDNRRKLEEKIGYSGIEATSEFLTLRRAKNPSELEAIKKAVNVAEEAMKRALNILEKGITESEVAAEILSFILRSGAQQSFQPIVAFGEHAAHPHAKPGLRRLERGNLVKIDLGARIEGYCSDLTRTVVFDRKNDLYKTLLAVVNEAQEHAISLMKPGVPARAVHMAAYDILKKKDLAKFFNHGLGHGVGIDVHEEPYLSAESENKLSPGDVVTVEPGVYIYRTGGVRIEDMVFIGEDSPLILTKFPKLIDV